jgi:hypothetical protein
MSRVILSKNWSRKPSSLPKGIARAKAIAAGRKAKVKVVRRGARGR